MASTPTQEPDAVVAGDTVTWLKTLADYPANTYTLKYRLINAAGKIDITAAASGTDHLVSVAPTTTDDWAAGDYSWTAWVEKTGFRATVGSGSITVKPNLAAETGGFDTRSVAQINYDQLMAAYRTYTQSNGLVSEYEIAGRRMRYKSSAEILEEINFWLGKVNDEKRAEKIAAGLGGGNKILVRF